MIKLFSVNSYDSYHVELLQKKFDKWLEEENHKSIESNIKIKNATISINESVMLMILIVVYEIEYDYSD